MNPRTKIALIGLASYATLYGGYRVAILFLGIPPKTEALVYRHDFSAGATPAPQTMRTTWVAVTSTELFEDALLPVEKRALKGVPLLQAVKKGDVVKRSDFVQSSSWNAGASGPKRTLWLMHSMPPHKHTPGESIDLQSAVGKQVSQGALILENSQEGYLVAIKASDLSAVIKSTTLGPLIATRRLGNPKPRRQKNMAVIHSGSSWITYSEVFSELRPDNQEE